MRKVILKGIFCLSIFAMLSFTGDKSISDPSVTESDVSACGEYCAANADRLEANGTVNGMAEWNAAYYYCVLFSPYCQQNQE